MSCLEVWVVVVTPLRQPIPSFHSIDAGGKCTMHSRLSAILCAVVSIAVIKVYVKSMTQLPFSKYVQKNGAINT